MHVDAGSLFPLKLPFLFMRTPEPVLRLYGFVQCTRRYYRLSVQQAPSNSAGQDALAQPETARGLEDSILLITPTRPLLHSGDGQLAGWIASSAFLFVLIYAVCMSSCSFSGWAMCVLVSSS